MGSDMSFGLAGRQAIVTGHRGGIGKAIHDVLTAKLFHAPRYRCLFKQIKARQVNTDPDGQLIAPRGKD